MLYNHNQTRCPVFACSLASVVSSVFCISVLCSSRPMAVNLPPQYHDAEARYKKAQTPEDKLAALKEMWVILPKHKASEKVQADLKTKISELTDQIEQARQAPRKAAPGTFKFPRQGAGQLVFVGPPNAGKSLLLSKLTKATPAVAPYPFTTREPVPGMMEYEDVRLQLIDLPPITADHYDPFVTDITRGADAAVLFLDLADDDAPAATQGVLDRLRLARRELVPPGSPPPEDPAVYALPTILVANKCDDDAADIRLEIAREEFGTRFQLARRLRGTQRWTRGTEESNLRLTRRYAHLHETTRQARRHDQSVYDANRRDGRGTGWQGSPRSRGDSQIGTRVGDWRPRRSNRRPRPRSPRQGRGRVAHVRSKRWSTSPDPRQRAK